MDVWDYCKNVRLFFRNVRLFDGHLVLFCRNAGSLWQRICGSSLQISASSAAPPFQKLQQMLIFFLCLVNTNLSLCCTAKNARELSLNFTRKSEKSGLRRLYSVNLVRKFCVAFCCCWWICRRCCEAPLDIWGA